MHANVSTWCRYILSTSNVLRYCKGKSDHVLFCLQVCYTSMWLGSSLQTGAANHHKLAMTELWFQWKRNPINPNKSVANTSMLCGTCWSILINIIVHKWYCGWTPCSWHLFLTLQQLEKLGGAQVTGDLRANSWLLWPAPAGGQRQECHPKTAVRSIIKIASGSMSNPTEVGYANLKLLLNFRFRPWEGPSYLQRLCAGGTAGALAISVFNPAEVAWAQQFRFASSRDLDPQNCCNQSVRCALAWIFTFLLRQDNS